MDVIKRYLTWQDIESSVQKILASMEEDGWRPSVVVGLTRGGLLPATLISHALGIPMCSLDVSLRDNLGPFGGPTSTWIPEEIANDHRILVVDDINDTGRTFEWIREDWLNTICFISPKGPDWPWTHIKFAAVVHNTPSSQPTDYHAITINKDEDPAWICFPWEHWTGK